MTRPGRGIARVVRGGALAATSAALALLGHAGAGGSGVRPVAVLVVTVWVAAVATLLARRQRGFSALFCFLMLAQLAFHVAFTVSGGHPAMSASGADALTSLADPGMALGHFAAALVSAWLLASGEASAWTVARLLTGRLRAAVRALRPPVFASRPRLRPRPPLSLTAEEVLLSRAMPRRGPPAPRSA